MKLPLFKSAEIFHDTKHAQYTSQISTTHPERRSAGLSTDSSGASGQGEPRGVTEGLYHSIALRYFGFMVHLVWVSMHNTSWAFSGLGPMCNVNPHAASPSLAGWSYC